MREYALLKSFQRLGQLGQLQLSDENSEEAENGRCVVSLASLLLVESLPLSRPQLSLSLSLFSLDAAETLSRPTRWCRLVALACMRRVCGGYRARWAAGQSTGQPKDA